MKEGVLAIVLQKESGQVLLVKRRDAGVWALPGGGLDDFEPPADAVIIEQPPHVVIADLINTMMVVKTIRDLAEKFSSKDTMMSHRNIWKLLQSFQK